MTDNYATRTTKLTDRQLIDLLFVLKKDMSPTQAYIRLAAGIDIDLLSIAEQDEQLTKLRSGRHAITSAHMMMDRAVQVQFYRGICDDASSPTSGRRPSPYFDEIFVGINQRHKTEDTVDQLVACIDRIEQTLPATGTFPQSAGANDVIDVLNVQITKLADQYTEMMRGLEKERAEFRTSFEEDRRTAEQEIDIARKRVTIEAEEQRNQLEEYRTKIEASLDERRTGLDQREKDLDDRHHMHARRELREQITNNFKERIQKPAVSLRSANMRLIVFFLTLTAGVGIGYFAAEDFKQTILVDPAKDIPQWLLMTEALRGIVLAVLAIGFIAYAINWLRLIYLDDVRTERRYESYGHDIDRASFVIETIMEVGEKENVEVPEAWVEGVCQNLFGDKSDDIYGAVPSNVASMLLDSIDGAKIGPEGAEVNIKRRGARRLARKFAKH